MEPMVKGRFRGNIRVFLMDGFYIVALILSFHQNIGWETDSFKML